MSGVPIYLKNFLGDIDITPVRQPTSSASDILSKLRHFVSYLYVSFIVKDFYRKSVFQSL